MDKGTRKTKSETVGRYLRTSLNYELCRALSNDQLWYLLLGTSFKIPLRKNAKLEPFNTNMCQAAT